MFYIYTHIRDRDRLNKYVSRYIDRYFMSHACYSGITKTSNGFYLYRVCI